MRRYSDGKITKNVCGKCGKIYGKGEDKCPYCELNDIKEKSNGKV